MPRSRVLLPPTGPRVDWEALRAELDVPRPFPAEALAEAEAAARAPRQPERDLTGEHFLTVDPQGSRDLDQALALSRTRGGYRLQYAIADVGAFVRAGGALDTACAARGVTHYFPDVRVPLHPPVLGEGAASLLEGQERPALVWTTDLDAAGLPLRTHVERARVRSRARLSYEQVQAALDAGTAEEPLQLLREVGLLLQQRARERGAVDLPVPDQEVADGPDGRPVLALRAPLPVEGWNAQLSLLTGQRAAALQLEGGTGLLRTLPEPSAGDVDGLRRGALALGVDWPQGRGWHEVVGALDARQPAHAALLTLATRLLRGAGYRALPAGPEDELGHSAVAAPYAHATAPLRRYADRWVGETCLALCAGREVPDEVRAVLPGLPALMTAAGRRAAAAERAVVDLAEAVLLAPRVGEQFDAAVVATGPRGAVVQLREPPVLAPADGDLPLGERVRVRLVEADPAARRVRFAPADGEGAG